MYIKLAIIYYLLVISSQFDKRCPILKEIYYMSRAKCKNPSQYHCLAVDNIRSNIYKEECRDKKWVSAGHFPILRGRYIDYEDCSADSYQPSRFWSNERYTCTFLKFLCSEIGQVECDAGNATTDRTCRCDTSRGYQYIRSVNNQRQCSSALEDLSCCFHSAGLSSKMPTTTYDLPTPKIDSSLLNETTLATLTNYIKTRGPIFEYVTTSLIGVTLVLVIVFGVKVNHLPLEKLKEHKRKEPAPKPTVRLEGTQQKQKNQAQFEKASTKGRASFETKPGLTEVANKCSIADGFQPNKSAASSKGIIILHVEDSSDPANKFQKYLTQCLPDVATKVIQGPGSFERGKPVCMDDILSQCDVLFVYIDRKFTKESLSKNGYDGDDIIANIYHRNVITVGGLGLNRAMKEAYNFKLDHLSLSKDNFKIKVKPLLTNLQEKS